MIGIILTAWHYAATRLSPLFFPSFMDVLKAIHELAYEGTLLIHMSVSLIRIVVGFLIGSIVAAPIGLLMGVSPFFGRFLGIYISFFRFIPAISVIIFAIVWFGAGEVSKIFLVFFATVFIVALNTEFGARNIPTTRVRGAYCLGANRYQCFFYVTVPSTVPFVLNGMRIAMGAAFAVIIAAELLSSEAGLGYLLESSRIFLKTDRVFVAVILLGILGFSTDRLFRFLIARFGGEYAGDKAR